MRFPGVRGFRTAGFGGRRVGSAAGTEPAQDPVDGELVVGLGARFVHAATATGRFRVPGRRRLDHRALVTGYRGRVRHLSVDAPAG